MLDFVIESNFRATIGDKVITSQAVYEYLEFIVNVMYDEIDSLKEADESIQTEIVDIMEELYQTKLGDIREELYETGMIYNYIEDYEMHVYETIKSKKDILSEIIEAETFDREEFINVISTEMLY